MDPSTPAASGPVGGDYILTLVSHFRAGNELWDREAGGIPRTVAKVETIIRVHFDPMAGQPDHRDYRPFVPNEARQFGRHGVPRPGDSALTAETNPEASWEHRDTAADQGVAPYPREADRAS